MKKQFANSSHTHNISDIGNLQNELNKIWKYDTSIKNISRRLDGWATYTIPSMPLFTLQQYSFELTESDDGGYLNVKLPSGGRYLCIDNNRPNLMGYFTGGSNLVSYNGGNYIILLIRIE